MILRDVGRKSSSIRENDDENDANTSSSIVDDGDDNYADDLNRREDILASCRILLSTSPSSIDDFHSSFDRFAQHLIDTENLWYVWNDDASDHELGKSAGTLGGTVVSTLQYIVHGGSDSDPDVLIRGISFCGMLSYYPIHNNINNNIKYNPLWSKRSDVLTAVPPKVIFEICTSTVNPDIWTACFKYFSMMAEFIIGATTDIDVSLELSLLEEIVEHLCPMVLFILQSSLHPTLLAHVLKWTNIMLLCSEKSSIMSDKLSYMYPLHSIVYLARTDAQFLNTVMNGSVGGKTSLEWLLLILEDCIPAITTTTTAPPRPKAFCNISINNTNRHNGADNKWKSLLYTDVDSIYNALVAVLNFLHTRSFDIATGSATAATNITDIETKTLTVFAGELVLNLEDYTGIEHCKASSVGSSEEYVLPFMNCTLTERRLIVMIALNLLLLLKKMDDQHSVTVTIAEAEVIHPPPCSASETRSSSKLEDSGNGDLEMQLIGHNSFLARGTEVVLTSTVMLNRIVINVFTEIFAESLLLKHRATLECVSQLFSTMWTPFWSDMKRCITDARDRTKSSSVFALTMLVTMTVVVGRCCYALFENKSGRWARIMGKLEDDGGCNDHDEEDYDEGEVIPLLNFKMWVECMNEHSFVVNHKMWEKYFCFKKSPY